MSEYICNSCQLAKNKYGEPFKSDNLGTQIVNCEAINSPIKANEKICCFDSYIKR